MFSNRHTSVAFLFALGLTACGPAEDRVEPWNRDGGPDFSAFGLPCPKPPADSDGDAISDHDEGADESPPRDTDHDGIPDYRDLDSDGDGIPDAIEGRNGNACTPPVDSDKDGVPDFRDLDSDDATDSTLPDKFEVGPNPIEPLDSDGDGVYDYLDPDDDGDGIPDFLEMTAQGAKKPATDPGAVPDTDGDGTPDYLDLDSDNDTIFDKYERYADLDGDFIPNFRDTDSDGDCVADRFEAGDDNPVTPPVDTDGDGSPDFADIDSDNDGLTDGVEDDNCSGTYDACETNRIIADSDGDGASDLFEHEACAARPVADQPNCICDGYDSSANPTSRNELVFLVPYQQAPMPGKDVAVLSTNLGQTDVLFAVDTTSTMQPSLQGLKNGLGQIVTQLKTFVLDPAFGVFQFRDLGEPHYDPTTTPPNIPSFGYPQRLQTIAMGTSPLQNAVSALTALAGGDAPQAGWSALYTIATPAKRSIAVTASSTFDLVTDPSVLPLSPGEVGGTDGGAGFRAGAFPVVITLTDSEWHDAPGSLVGADSESGKNPYPSTTGAPLNDPACNPCTNVPSRREAVTALQNLGARVIGLAAMGTQTFGDPKTRALKLAQETGAIASPADWGSVGVRPAGCGIGQCCTGLDGSDTVVGEAAQGGQCSLAFTVDGDNGNGIVGAVVSGLQALYVALRFDVHVQASDVDAGTVNNFLTRLDPNLSGIGLASMCVSSLPTGLQDKYTGPKAVPGADGNLDTLPGLGGGAYVCFDVIPKENDSVPQTDKPQVFRARLQALGVSGSRAFNLGSPRDVFFIVPPTIVNTPIP